MIPQKKLSRFQFPFLSMLISASTRPFVLQKYLQHPFLRSSNSFARRTMASASNGNAPKEPLLVRFYSPTVQGTDFRGRTLSTILSWNYRKLEVTHDYVQTLFPMPESSIYNHDAPLVDRATFEAFRSRSDLRDRLREALKCMLDFYGLELQESTDSGSREVTIVPGTNFLQRAGLWVVHSNHNHQRMTRMIRSLRILGLEEEALAFYSRLERISRANKDIIGWLSLNYWKLAAERPLYWPPQDVTYKENGKDFLLELYQENTK